MALFLEMEFEIPMASKAKSEAQAVLAPVEARCAADEQTKADAMTQKLEQLLSLIKSCRDTYSEYRLRVHIYLLV